MFNVVVVAEEENNRRQEVVVVRSNKRNTNKKGTAALVCAEPGCYQRWSGAIGLRYTGFSSWPCARICPTAEYSRIHCAIEGF